jgi:hypothetical protein
MSVDLRLGDYREVLADVGEVDALVCDPPYSERTHEGQRTGSSVRSPTIAYQPLTEEAAGELASFWSARVRHWAIVWSDHAGSRWHEEAWLSCGWYVFAPLPYIKHPCAPRLAGDGPATASEWITIARPRRPVRGERAGSRPGWYLARGRTSNEAPAGVAGQKDVAVVRQILREYTLPGDWVADPFSGSGTTARACMIEGRRFVGAEKDPATHKLATERIRGLGPSTETQPSLFGGGRG